MASVRMALKEKAPHMFTGIVQEVGTIVSAGGGRLTVAAKSITRDMTPGASVAVNGVCLTVTDFDDTSFSVDVMPETLRRTNLGRLKPGDSVNLERALAAGGEFGGHFVQGHVDDTGRIVQIQKEGDAIIMRFSAGPEVMRYIVPKGFIAVDGISLTVVERDATGFSVSIVGYTREHTTLAGKRPGDLVNLEVDIIGKYVAAFLSPEPKGITMELLREHGFAVDKS
ncbi:MAG: riboflavin synthase [Dehalococcoidales bacterium]|nr:riboflavin synthase [Dehalococcoidales bacterium]